MKHFAQRSEISDSATLKINNDVINLIKKGVNVIPFVAGEPDFSTPEIIKKGGIEAIQNNCTHYTASSGIVELRKAIADKLYKENGLSYDIDEIIVSNGAKQAIANALLAIIDGNAEVLIPSPYWVSYKAMVDICGGKANIVETKKENKFKVTVEDLKERYNEKCKVLILNSPTNPTGAVYSKNELLEIGKFCVENDIFIISDEIYEKLVYDGLEHISIASLGSDIFEKTITINGFSKSYAMTGWRIGYSAAPNTITSIMKKFQSNTTSNASSISQYAALNAFKIDEFYFKNLIDTFTKRRDFIYEKLKDNPFLDVISPHGAFYFFIDISKLFGHSYKGKKINSDIDFYSILLNDAGVAVVPGSAFGNKNCFRLSYSYSLSTIKEGIDRLLKVLSSIE